MYIHSGQSSVMKEPAPPAFRVQKEFFFRPNNQPSPSLLYLGFLSPRPRLNLSRFSASPLVELPREVDRPEKFKEGTVVLHRDPVDLPYGFHDTGQRGLCNIAW